MVVLRSILCKMHFFFLFFVTLSAHCLERVVAHQAKMKLAGLCTLSRRKKRVKDEFKRKAAKCFLTLLIAWGKREEAFKF